MTNDIVLKLFMIGSFCVTNMGKKIVENAYLAILLEMLPFCKPCTVNKNVVQEVC